MFVKPYDVRMYLATLNDVANSDSEIQQQEDVFIERALSTYEARLRLKIDMAKVRSVKKNEIYGWQESLRKCPCTARYLVKKVIELIWADGTFAVGEYATVVKLAKRCGVPQNIVWILINCVRVRVEADNVLQQILQNGDPCENVYLEQDVGSKCDVQKSRREWAETIEEELKKGNQLARGKVFAEQLRAKGAVFLVLWISYLILFVAFVVLTVFGHTAESGVCRPSSGTGGAKQQVSNGALEKR